MKLNRSSGSPLIILGMHRSGTSLLARCLEQMGLFIGNNKDNNSEAVFFQRINTWLFAQCGGRWDYPLPVRGLVEDLDVRAGLEEYLEFMLTTPRVASYLGWPAYLRHRGLKGINRPWGWKDPRNTFTLPFWLDVFPEARVLHVYRHGVDVANSLLVRRNMTVLIALRNFRRRKVIHWFIDKKGGFSQSSRCSNIAGGVEVWKEYMTAARQQVVDLGDRAKEIKYEDFLDNPLEILCDLTKFVGVDSGEEVLLKATNGISKSRAYAYRSEGDLVSEAKKVTAILGEFGYEV